MRILQHWCRYAVLALVLGAAVMCPMPAGLAVATAQEKKEKRDAFAEGVTLLHMGEYKQAVKQFSEVCATDPKNAAAYRWRGRCFSFLKDYEKAIKDYDEAVRLGTGDATVYTDRGSAWYNKADYDKAIKDFDEAIRLIPNANTYRSRGHAWYNKADYDKAIEDYGESIRLIPNADTYRERGNAWKKKQNASAATADLTTAFLLEAGAYEEVREGDLEERLSKEMVNSTQVSVVVCVPQYKEIAPIAVHVVTTGVGGKKKYLRSEVSSEVVWQKCVKLLADQSFLTTSVEECDTHDTPHFRDSRGVRVSFNIGRSRELAVAPDRKLKLTPEVLKHFRVESESNYPSERTAVIITEAHNSLDQQIASYRGLESLLSDNPWLKDKGEAAFLVEALEAGERLSVRPLVRARPKPSDGLVLAALGSYLVPSYVAIEWKHQHGIPLVGHEDMKLYKFCNYMHWATSTRHWTGKDLEVAEFLQSFSVGARNKSSGETFVKSLGEYNCPILFIGYGHIGPYSRDTGEEVVAELRRRYGERWDANLRQLMPDEPMEWLTTVSTRSVVSYLKEKKIGFVVLEPRADPLVDMLSVVLRAYVDYTDLRKAQHDGEMGPYLDKYRGGKAGGCTTMPDPATLAELLPTLEANGLPQAELYTPQGRAEQLSSLLGDCGTLLGCFPAGTTVRTDSGPRAIESLMAGGIVWGCDPTTGKWGEHRVEGVVRAEYDGDFVTVTVGKGKVTATGNHPFWVYSGDRIAERPDASHVPAKEAAATATGRWVNARDLRRGDLLLSATGEAVAVDSVTAENGKRAVYTLRVADVHTFAVGEPGLLVHNNCKWVPAALFRDPKFEKNLTDHLTKLNPEFKKPKECAAHHLIPVAEAQQSEFLKAAAKGGYNINRPQNGMFLPRTEGAAVALRLPLHKGNHQGYSDYVGGRLKKLDAEFKRDAKNPGTKWNSDRMNTKVRNLESDLRRQLRTGKFDLGD